MVETFSGEFKQAHRKEKDPRSVEGMAAANVARHNLESTQHVADSLMQCPNRILTWTRRFGEDGVDSLGDLPEAEDFQGSSARRWIIYWSSGERGLLNSEHHETFDGMRRTVSTYLSTVRFAIDMRKYLDRKASKCS